MSGKISLPTITEGIFMKIRKITENKKQFMQLLLDADPDEKMIDRYLERGCMYVLYENEQAIAECVVTEETPQIAEIKNIAVRPDMQGYGYGRKLIDFIADTYRKKYSVLQVGTGDSPVTTLFYEECGFVFSHILPGFFTDNYDEPIWDGEVLLKDMVVYRRILREDMND